MIQNNRLDKAFGPIGSIAGVTLLIVGSITIFFSLSGLFLILLGAFIGFTSTSTFIDVENKRVRFSNNLFGIIQTGKWISIDPAMKIDIKQSNRTWRAYSRGSRSIDITDKDFRIILYDINDKPILNLMKAKTIESAKNECNNLTACFGISLMK